MVSTHSLSVRMVSILEFTKLGLLVGSLEALLGVAALAISLNSITARRFTPDINLFVVFFFVCLFLINIKN